MIRVTLDKQNHIAVLEPTGPLSETDFQLAAKEIDSMIDEFGQLNGLVVHSESFPGWDSLSAMVSHLRFVKDHHHKFLRLALATDSVAARIAEVFASHFVSAEIKIFPYKEFAAAKRWVGSDHVA